MTPATNFVKITNRFFITRTSLKLKLKYYQTISLTFRHSLNFLSCFD